MKKYFIIFLNLWSIISTCSAVAQPFTNDHDAEIMKIKGKWTKRSNVIDNNDPAFPQIQYPFAFRKFESIASLVKLIYPNPAGLEAFYYGAVGTGEPWCHRLERQALFT